MALPQLSHAYSLRNTSDSIGSFRSICFKSIVEGLMLDSTTFEGAEAVCTQCQRVVVVLDSGDDDSAGFSHRLRRRAATVIAHVLPGSFQQYASMSLLVA